MMDEVMPEGLEINGLQTWSCPRCVASTIQATFKLGTDRESMRHYSVAWVLEPTRVPAHGQDSCQDGPGYELV